MNRNIKGRQIHNLLPMCCLLFLILCMTGCATQLRIHSDFVPAGSLRLAQVMQIGKRADILQSKDIYEAIIASGIKDSDIADGSVVVARIFCCGGISANLSSERANAIMMFVPSGITAGLGDVVEVRSGHPPEKGDAGQLNVVTRMVQKYEDKEGGCWWDPKDDRLWLRVLYCDWMPKEGWIKQGGTNPAWYLPPSSVTSEK